MRRPPAVGPLLRLAVLVLAAALLASAAAAGPVTVRGLDQDGDRITVRYDLGGAGPATVSLVGSVDGGRSFDRHLGAVSGDVGPGVEPGPGKVIRWDARGDFPGGIEHLDLLLDVVARPEGDHYLVVPLHGTVGREITAAVLERCLAAALELRPAAVVFEVDSPGGLLAELFKLIDLSVAWQRRHPDQRTVVLVRDQAMSAAAVFATTVPEIYLLPGSAIGAAMAINVQRGKVTAVQEKFSSAYRGRARAAAEAGGHDPLLVEAMIDPDLALHAETGADGAVVLNRGSGGRQLVARQKLLTLTAGEAVEVGLAAAVVDGYRELGERLGHPGWLEAPPAAREIVAAWEEEVAGVEADYGYLVATIKDGLSRLRQSSGTDLSAIGGNLWEVRQAVDELEQIAVDYPFMRPVVRDTFDRPTGEIKLQFDRALGELKRHRLRRSRSRRN